jgi:hypothetical protein
LIEFNKKIFTLRELLRASDELLDDGVSIFVEKGCELGLDTSCAILSDEDYNEAGNSFQTIAISGFTMSDFLPVDAFEQVINNAYLQRNDVSTDMLLAALRFYFDNDAFINFDDTNDE